jgi:signal transduction histidine kinase
VAKRPFGQIETGQQRVAEGSGLGLPISLALARLHGGDLIIESEKNAGTRVTVLLPAHVQPTVN